MIDEPVFQQQIPERHSSAFSRQWCARGDWKLDEPTLMIKVDRTKQKMAELLRRISILGGDNVIPEWLYSSLYNYIRWVMYSTGVYKISMDMVRDSSSGIPVIRYMEKTQKIYPKTAGVPTMEEWDPIVMDIGKMRKDAEYCAVMPSMETVEWLNGINTYCNEMDEWANGTYLQTQEKLRASKQFLKNIHAKWAGS